MRKLRLRVWTAGLVPAVAAVTLIGVGIAYAFDSGDKPGGTGANTITWTGQGVVGGLPKTVECGTEDPNALPPDIDVNEPYLLWVLTPDGGAAHLRQPRRPSSTLGAPGQVTTRRTTLEVVQPNS